MGNRKRKFREISKSGGISNIFALVVIVLQVNQRDSHKEWRNRTSLMTAKFYLNIKEKRYYISKA